MKMKALVGTIGVAAVLAATAFTTPAYASTDPVGQKCRFNSSTDFTAEAQTQFGPGEGGPLLITSTSGTVGAHCQIYVNGVAAVDAGFDLTITPVGANLYLAAGGDTVTYHSNVSDVVTMCTSATYDGKTWYWHPAPVGDPNLGTWDNTFALDKCAQAITIDPNPEACPPLLTIDKYAGTGLAVIWQDCEPYSPLA